jgi:alginate O-acetyltransferase complex protein AlgI
MWPDDLNWQMTVAYLLALALMGFAMKFVALFVPATIPAHRPHVFWLLLSPASNRRLRPIENVPRLLLRTVVLCATLVLAYWSYWQLLRVTRVHGVALGYAAAPIVLLMSETLVALVSVLWLPSGRLLPTLHNRPWRARSVADFWGRRWNLWFSDWSHTIFQRLRRRPVFALVLIFAVSGLLHEWVINVPLYFITGRMLFGTMMLYFLLQAVGVLVERRFKGHPACRVAFTWLVVLAPAPLVVNEGLLRTLHLWPEAN